MLSFSSLRPRRSLLPFLATACFFLLIPSSPSSSSFPSLRFQRHLYQPHRAHVHKPPGVIHVIDGSPQPTSPQPEHLLTFPPPSPLDVDGSTHVQPEDLYPHRPITPSPITMIIMWSPRGGKPPKYLSHFFSSVLANPTIDLLIIKHDREGAGVDCSPMAPQGVAHSNIREVCFTQQEYFGRHAKWLCDLPDWTCSDDDMVKLTSDLIRFGKEDAVRSTYLSGWICSCTEHIIWIHNRSRRISVPSELPSSMTTSIRILQYGMPVELQPYLNRGDNSGLCGVLFRLQGLGRHGYHVGKVSFFQLVIVRLSS